MQSVASEKMIMKRAIVKGMMVGKRTAVSSLLPGWGTGFQSESWGSGLRFWQRMRQSLAPLESSFHPGSPPSEGLWSWWAEWAPPLTTSNSAPFPAPHPLLHLPPAPHPPLPSHGCGGAYHASPQPQAPLVGEHPLVVGSGPAWGEGPCPAQCPALKGLALSGLTCPVLLVWGLTSLTRSFHSHCGRSHWPRCCLTVG